MAMTQGKLLLSICYIYEILTQRPASSPSMPHRNHRIHMRYLENKPCMRLRAGLGTNTADEGREYFSNLSRHLLPFEWSGRKDSDDIAMAFSKDKVKQRKLWLNEPDNESSSAPVMSQESSAVTFSDFINQELIRFSRADIHRSIPSAIDGLKPSQRKVLFGCFKRNLQEEVKVAQLAGYIRYASPIKSI